MTDTNITRAEAKQRSTLLTASRYDVHVDLTDVRASDSPTFPSTTTASFGAVAGSSSWIDLRGPDRCARAVLNGVAARPRRLRRASGSRSPTSPPRTSSWSWPTAPYMHTGEGLHRFVDPVDEQVYLYTPVRGRRRPPGVRVLRPARPEGDVHASP